MSRWTHVAGVIRVDVLRLNHDNKGIEKKLMEILGTPKDYDEIDWDDEGKPNTIVPCGSEGSLEYEIFLNKKYDHVSAGHITITGDLRDFGGDEDVEKIRAWFFKVCDKLAVRQAVIEICDEYVTGCKIYSYKEDSDGTETSKDSGSSH